MKFFQVRQNYFAPAPPLLTFPKYNVGFPTTVRTSMRSYSKARTSSLTATEHARNRTLPDLPFPWPWEIWV